MNFYIGNTDYQWYKFLSELHPEDVNFWQPSGHARFAAVPSGSPFLLKLKRPINKVAGIGFFTSHSILPIGFAWEVFQQRNGVATFDELLTKINSYRNVRNTLRDNPNIGCIILTNPIFFDPSDWVTAPDDWSPNIVQGKTYRSDVGVGKRYWEHIERLLVKYINIDDMDRVDDPQSIYSWSFMKQRMGQGAFRVMVTDAYNRRCAISGEKTLPVLEAAHIKPYSYGIQTINNGLLLRSDLHKLFDTGYMTVSQDYHIEVSKRIREEFENGRDYYRYHGNSLISMPNNIMDLPDKQYLTWHNENVYRG
jgi:putative restriction endonuclease